MKLLTDQGHCAEATKPLRLKRYEPGRLPDPGQCVDCAIIINDRSSSEPRGRLAVSNGAAWDIYEIADGGTASAVALRPEIDLTPMVREAVAAMLPAMQAPSVKVIQPQTDTASIALLQDADRVTATALLELSEHMNRLLRENADLMARVEFLERHAIAMVEAKAS